MTALPRNLEPQSTRPTRVVVVDDQATIRLGLSMILDNEPDITVVGEAADGEQAVASTHRLRPDVVLMDIRMPHVDGIEATRRITTDSDLQETRTLVLTTFDDDEYIYGALRAGAAGFLLKDTDPQTLVEAVHRVHAGDSLLDRAVTRRIIAGYLDFATKPPMTTSPEKNMPLGRLTRRERETVLAVSRGLSNREIGAELHLTEATVKSHVRSVLAKLGLTNRVQLVIFAYESGLILPAGDTASHTQDPT